MHILVGRNIRKRMLMLALWRRSIIRSFSSSVTVIACGWSSPAAPAAEGVPRGTLSHCSKFSFALKMEGIRKFSKAQTSTMSFCNGVPATQQTGKAQTLNPPFQFNAQSP